MKIFSAAQIRAWDAYTIKHEPVRSIDLMNRAARAFTDWFIETFPDTSRKVVVCCGTGNNGGDGLAVARMLDQAQYAAKVVVCDFGTAHSDDFEAQLALIHPLSTLRPQVFDSFNALLEQRHQLMDNNDLVIDALFGTGLSRPPEDDWSRMIQFLNTGEHDIVSIDIPSGLFCDRPTTGSVCVKACRTFSFQAPKLAFFFPENAEAVGDWTYGSIGLHPGFEEETETPFYYLTTAAARNLLRPRSKFSHKGTFGHALLIAGSFGKMGAAVLAAGACLRSGVGLLTMHTPRSGNIIVQSSVPEAMVSADRKAKYWSEVPDLQSFSSIGAGPGIGRATETETALKSLIQQVAKPLVLDADALNIVAENPGWLDLLPENTILTPHPKEFERLFGKTEDGYQRNHLQRKKAEQYRVFIVLKGAHTAIACPDGTCWFNSTGNPGMATGGTGDVLTGILTGLLAQGYSAKNACLLGVYLHGLAGDMAASALSREGMTAGDLISFLGKAWLSLSNSIAR